MSQLGHRQLEHLPLGRIRQSVVPILTRIRRSLRYSDTKTGSLPLRPILWRSRMIPYCQVVSYAFSKSKKRPTACCLRANASRRYLSRLTRWSVVLRCFLKPHWLLSNIPDFSRYQMKRVLIMRSRTLHKQLVYNWGGQCGPYLVWGLGSLLLLSIDEESPLRSISCLGSLLGFSVYPQGDASTGCCGSHQVQVHMG